MDVKQIKQTIATTPYEFLKTNPHLGDNIIFLTLSGSYAYGMNKETSDLDLRGIALNSKREILVGRDFEQVVEECTDTTIYSFQKAIELFSKANPNTIELLGCRPEHYLWLSDMGRELLENRRMFLSRRVIHTFANYGESQLRRMENQVARLSSQENQETHILRSIENARYAYKDKYLQHPEDAIHLYIDKSDRPKMNTEIFMDLKLQHYPLRDYANMWNEMKAVVSNYGKIGKRNRVAMTHNKLGKHMAHTLRLYLMCIDILEKEEIITYREKEHDLLMRVRNGEFLDETGAPIAEFYDILNEYTKRFEYAKNNISLPEQPDYKRIEEFQMSVNERVVRNHL